MTPSDFSQFISESTSYAVFMDFFKKNTDAVKAGHEILMAHAETLPLNWQRTLRVEKTVSLNNRIQHSLNSLNGRKTWLVVTEPWCGDSAQCLPVIQKIAATSQGKIELRVILRDHHTALIDAFLTNGARSIPKLIQLNDQHELQATWGPRPAEAQELIERLKSNPSTAGLYKEELHKWYASNKGEAIQDEIAAMLESTG